MMTQETRLVAAYFTKSAGAERKTRHLAEEAVRRGAPVAELAADLRGYAERLAKVELAQGTPEPDSLADRLLRAGRMRMSDSARRTPKAERLVDTALGHVDWTYLAEAQLAIVRPAIEASLRTLRSAS